MDAGTKLTIDDIRRFVNKENNYEKCQIMELTDIELERVINELDKLNNIIDYIEGMIEHIISESYYENENIDNTKFAFVLEKIKELKDEDNVDLKELENMVEFYDELLNELYSDLIELNHNIKTNTSKDKLIVKVQDMIIKIGGRR